MTDQGRPGGESASRDHLLDVAERLFAENGIAETSIRAITAAAGVNVAAVNYHFGSKESLVQEVVARRLIPHNQECLHLLKACRQGAGNTGPTVEALLRAFVSPSIYLCFQHPYFALLASRLRLDADRSPWKMYRVQRASIRESFREAFGSALPQLAAEEVAERLRYIVGAVHHLWSHCPMKFGKTPEGVLRSFVTFYAAALRAPACGLASELPSGD